ncbi:MAG TPA: thiol reductant ABC exporter subunit CydC [Ktedonobacterales bacterium]|jgi:ATP-binding cassette subfamily C protein CydC|nr:thiol reductant ABC exporter subunit CydC [Ktedonobacterales bacterium]
MLDKRATATTRRLIGFLAAYRGEVALAALLGFATVAAGVGLMATSSWLISAAALHPVEATLAVAIVGVRFFGLARGVFRYLERYVSHSVTFRLLGRLRVWAYDAIERLAPTQLQTLRSGDLLTRMVADIETLQHLYVRVIAPPVVALLTSLALFAFLAAFDPRLALVAVGTLLLCGVGIPIIARRLAHAAEWRVAALRADLMAATVDTTQGMAELLAFGQDERQQRQLAAISASLAREQRRLSRVNGLSAAMLLLGTQVAALLTLLVAIPLVSAGKVEGVWLATLALAVTASFEAVAPLPEAGRHMESAAAAGRRVFALTDMAPSVTEPPAPAPLPVDATLAFEHVSFRHAVDEPPALDDLNLTLRRGEMIAVVGPSGAGKSTLAMLLERFANPTSGQITLGGMDVRQLVADDVRSQLAVVSQGARLFNTSVRQNLLIARPDATDEQLVAAARRARAHEMIMALPQGYDTLIGEQGLRLSGGERQRLAIARAMLRDAPILILDEPTAHLDTETERAVLQGLAASAPDHATLLITHRLIGLSAAREIIVLRAGHVVERGTERELLALGGLYTRLRAAQRQALSDDGPETFSGPSPDLLTA